MIPQAYQNAFAEATSELNEINVQAERLRIRMELIQSVVVALKPIVEYADLTVIQTHQEAFLPPAVLPENFEEEHEHASETAETADDGMVFTPQDGHFWGRRIGDKGGMHFATR
jgi:hypothetical protein